MATWPTSVLDRCLEIRKLTASGKKLEEVREILGPFNPKKKRSYRFKNNWEQREKDLSLFRVRDAVGKTLRKFARACLDLDDLKVITAAHLQKAAKLISDGHNPVLVVTESSSEIAPDFLVSHVLAEQSNIRVLAVLPIKRFLSEQEGEAKTASVPVRKIVVKSSSRTKVVPFEYDSEFDFKVLKK
jgi:hypothetical protein